MRSLIAVSFLLVACGPSAAPAPEEPANLAGEDTRPADAPTLAMIVVIDRSGSMMGAKMEMALETARTIPEVALPETLVGVVAFDSAAAVIVEPQPAANADAIQKQIQQIETGGGTDFRAAIALAGQLIEGAKVSRALVLFISDGQAATEGTFEAIRELAARGVTVSTVAIGDADRALLGSMAEAGNGRAYAFDSDVSKIPRIGMKEVEALQSAP